jgi:aminopeptidase 2
VKGTSVFSLNDRLGVINDSAALAKAGIANITGVFNLIRALADEKECKLTCDID